MQLGREGWNWNYVQCGYEYVKVNGGTMSKLRDSPQELNIMCSQRWQFSATRLIDRSSA